MAAMRPPRHSSIGFTFVEIVIYILVVSIGMIGILAIFQVAGKNSSETMARKQEMEAAEALLEEIELMPFTWCEPNDPAAQTAQSTADCSIAQGLAPTPGQSRGDALNPYNHVGDYAGYAASPPTDILGQTLPGLAGYSYSVSITPISVGGIPSSDLLRIDVSVSGSAGSMTATGYKARHSPNATP